MAIIYGGQYGDPYVNNSGGALAVGDVVVQDTTGDDYVDTTNVDGDLDVVGVVIRGGADTEPVRAASTGVVEVKVDGAVARGDFLKASTTVTRATATAIQEAGVFAVARTAWAGPGVGTVWALMLFPVSGVPPGHVANAIYGTWGSGGQDGSIWNSGIVWR